MYLSKDAAFFRLLPVVHTCQHFRIDMNRSLQGIQMALQMQTTTQINLSLRKCKFCHGFTSEILRATNYQLGTQNKIVRAGTSENHDMTRLRTRKYDSSKFKSAPRIVWTYSIYSIHHLFLQPPNKIDILIQPSHTNTQPTTTTYGPLIPINFPRLLEAWSFQHAIDGIS